MLGTIVDGAYSAINATACFVVLFTIGTFFPHLRQFIFIPKNTGGHVDFRTLFFTAYFDQFRKFA
jgi:hypothetical protein